MKNVTQTILDATNGQLKISDQFIVSKNTVPGDICGQYKPNEIEIRDVSNGFIHYTIRDVKLQDKYFYFSFCFFHGTLYSLTLGFKNQPGFLSWNDWSEAKGIQNKIDHDDWLTSEIGPNRVFPWGKTEAYFDPKGGGSGIVLRYY